MADKPKIPPAPPAAVKDYAIPIVFPDYLIAVTVAKRKVDLIPGVNWDDFTLPSTSTKLPELGHAGVLLINGASGTTRYYEYGRYDAAALGLTRSLRIANVTITKGEVNWGSLKVALKQISTGAGHGGRIEAALIDIEGQFAAMDKYAQQRVADNKNPKRKPYDLTGNSCIHFAKSVVEAGGADTPWMVDPRPKSYIGEFQSSYPDLTYDPKTNKLKIEDRGEF